MNDTSYNGWSNYQTWVVNLWIDNSEGDQDYWTEQATECVQEAIDDDECDIRPSATYALSKRLEESFDEQHAEITGVTGVFADLLSNALGMVDWYEIAKHYVGDIEIYSAGWNMPGYMPDNPPSMFLDADDALEFIKDAMKTEVAVAEYTGPSQSNYDDTLIESWKADSKGEFGQQFGAYHYFVSIV